MGQRGKKPDSQIGLAQKRVPERPEPLKGMSGRARKTWRDIVDSLPPGYFRKGAWPLLRAYCEADADHFRASEIIAKLEKEFVGEKDVIKLAAIEAKLKPITTLKSTKSTELSSLASKLRLSPSSYRDRDAAGKDGREQAKPKRAGLLFGGKEE